MYPVWVLKKDFLSLSLFGQIVHLGLLIPWLLSVTRCAASACRVSSYDIPGHPAISCNMDDLIKSGKEKVKDLDAVAISTEINSKFTQLHIMAIEYSQAVARAGWFLSCDLVSFGRFAIF